MNFIKGLFKFLCFFLSGALLWPVNSYAQINKTLFENEVFQSELAIPSLLFPDNITDYFFDSNGTLVFSSAKKIGIYTGSRWDYFELSFEPVLAVSSEGTIFIASENVIYKLAIDSAENYFLSEYIEIIAEGEESVKQIICIEKEILINTQKGLYSFEAQNLHKIIDKGEDICIFKTKTRTIIRNGTKYTGYSAGSGLGPWFDSNQSYTLIEDHPQGFIAYSETGSRFDILAPSFSSLHSWSMNFGEKILDLLYLPNESFGVLTIDQVYYQIGPSGEVLSHTELYGLNEYSKLKHSSMDRIWISNSYGFSILDFRLPFQKINTENLKSGIISSCYSNEKLYVSDGYGLYEFPGKMLLDGRNINSLTSLNEGLLYLQNEILYYYDEGQSKQVWADKIKDFKLDLSENKILLDLSDSFFIVKPSSSGFFEEYKSFKKDFEQDYSYCKNSLIYFTDHSIYRINLENLKKDSLIFSPKELESKILQLLCSNDQYLIGTQGGIYWQKSDSTQLFESENREQKKAYQKILFTNNDALLSYWVENTESPGFINLVFADGKEEGIYFLPKDISIFNNLNIIRVREKEYFLINPKSIFHYFDNEADKRKIFFVIPERISLNGKEVFDGKIFNLEKTKVRDILKNLAYKNNSFEMEFSSSDFLSGNSKFQYILMGRDKQWSDWKAGNKLFFSNLKPGDYLLKLRLNNDNNYISETFKLNITVLSPLYLSNYAIALYILVLLVAMFVIYRWYLVHSLSKEEEKEEKDKIKIEAFNKSEILDEAADHEPNSAKTLENKKSKWDKYSMVTVLFSDIQGFTKIAEMMNPEKLIDELDQFFFHFDSVVEKYNIEKIKTIGDAYMAAGGIPIRNITNPVEVVLAALEMQQHMKQLKKTKEDIWDLRIGIHTGPVIAGEIGHKKRSYDIWGDSVNIASRMESTGEGGKVNVSEVTYHLIKDFFICEYRGKIPVKYKGNLDMYFVTGLRPELSINLVGLPNKMFFLKLQLKRLHDLEEFVFDKMDQELPKALCFHTSAYARHVYDHSLLLSKSESLDVEEGLEVRTASLLLHLGYIKNYKNPEVESANSTHDILTRFQYSERQINIIRNLILSTKPPYEPQNVMEKIMIDTRMEYLGRADYLKNSKLLFKEENEMLGPVKLEKWKSKQIEKLSNFDYYTFGARRLREISFEEQIENLKKDNL